MTKLNGYHYQITVPTCSNPQNGGKTKFTWKKVCQMTRMKLEKLFDFAQLSTHALMMTVRAALRSLSMNQSIKYPDILGAVLYREKNLT